jgi:hypothetical protein
MVNIVIDAKCRTIGIGADHLRNIWLVVLDFLMKWAQRAPVRSMGGTRMRKHFRLLMSAGALAWSLAPGSILAQQPALPQMPEDLAVSGR